MLHCPAVRGVVCFSHCWSSLAFYVVMRFFKDLRKDKLKILGYRTSLVIQRRGSGLIPGQGTKIMHTTRHSQKQWWWWGGGGGVTMLGISIMFYHHFLVVRINKRLKEWMSI